MTETYLFFSGRYCEAPMKSIPSIPIIPITPRDMSSLTVNISIDIVTIIAIPIQTLFCSSLSPPLLDYVVAQLQGQDIVDNKMRIEATHQR